MPDTDDLTVTVTFDAEPFLLAIDNVTAAWRSLCAAAIEAVSSIAAFVAAALGPDLDALARRYAIERLGVTEVDIKRIILDDPRRPIVVQWNGRRHTIDWSQA